MKTITNGSDCHHYRLHGDCAYTLWEMRYLRAITLALMLVAWSAGTVAACCLPSSQPAEHQKASCREMGPQCNGQMQASHSCCTKSVTHDQSSLIARCHDLRPELAVAQLGSHEGSWDLRAALIPAGSFNSPSPPGPVPGAATILRI